MSMTGRCGIGILALLASPAFANHGGGGHAGSGGGGHFMPYHGSFGGYGGGHHLGYPGSYGGSLFAYPYYGVPYAPIFVTPPPVFMVTGPALPPWPGPASLPASATPRGQSFGGAPRAKKADPAKAERMIELGDHLFRSHNFSRATERFQQAIKADPGLAAPHVRLAQVALVRGRYAEAADAFRRAEAVQPGWLVGAKDVQALYAEPADFGRQVARLESHLQAHPDDRDAWFVLGATWFLSGRSRKASDVFLRLSDRRVDAALAAFLAASQPEQPAAN